MASIYRRIGTSCPSFLILIQEAPIQPMLEPVTEEAAVRRNQHTMKERELRSMIGREDGRLTQKLVHICKRLNLDREWVA